MKVIYASMIGSKLYGVSNANSDTDFKGFCIEDTDAILGLKTFEQQEYKNGVEDGPDKIEGCIFSLRRYLNLCMKGNPTVIEIAWSDPKFHLHQTELGKEIVEFTKKEFLSLHLFRPYSAYHMAQMKKLQSIERTGKRAAEVQELGYDAKFSYHAYRLARQCVVIMSEGVLRPTLDQHDKELALKIRSGVFSKEEILEILQKVDVEMYDAYKTSTLPKEPNYNKVNDFCVDVYSRYLKGEFDSQLTKEFKPY